MPNKITEEPRSNSNFVFELMSAIFRTEVDSWPRTARLSAILVAATVAASIYIHLR